MNYHVYECIGAGRKRTVRKYPFNIKTAAVLFFLLFFTASAVSAGKLPELRIGVTCAPGAFEDDGRGVYSGILYSHIEGLAIYAEFSPVYVTGTLDENMQRLADGEIDMTIVAKRDSEADDGFLRTVRSIMRMPCNLYFSGDIGVHPRIGYCTKFHNEEILKKTLYEHAAYADKDYIPVAFDSLDELIKAWEIGSIEGIAVSGFEYLPEEEARCSLFLENFYLAMPAGKEELKTRIIQAMEKIRSLGPEKMWGATPENRNFGGQPLFLQRDEKEYLKNHPVIRVSVYAGQAPYAYMAGDEVHGIYPDYFKRAGLDLGVEFRMIPAKTYSESMEMVHDGRADMVASVYSDPAWAKENDMWFTFPYMDASYTGIIRRDRGVTKNPRVAAVRGVFFTKQYIEKNFPKEQIVYYDTDRDAIEAVRSGLVDMCYAKILLAQLLLTQPEYAVLYSTGQSVMLQDVAMGVCRRTDPILVRILNKEISHIGVGATQAIIDESALAITPEHSWRTFVYYYPIRTLTAVILFSSFLIGVVVYIYRQRQKNYERLQYAAYRHSKSGLYNLRWFEENLPLLIEENREAREDGRLYIMLNNVCHFDRLMAVCSRHEATVLQKEILASMHAHYPWFYRYATPGTLNQSYVFCVFSDRTQLQRILAEFESDIHVKSTLFPVSMQYNVGIVQVPPTGEISALELIQQVEIAQAEADESGALYCIYDEKLMAKRARHQQIESMFRKSLEAGEFEVWYQPKYDLYTNEAAGAEALVRWNSSAMGEVQPAGFVPVLERTSLILELDYYVLEKTMRYLKGRIDAGLPVVPVSVNQSGKHVAETGYLDRMRQLAEKIPLPKGLIELEITETAFVDYETQAAREDAVHIARELRSMGYRLAMDDFCTGYSSIAMLQTLPMDTIKIDRAVLLAAEKDSKGLTILRGVIDFGRRLGMTVLCEGIETREQEQMLRENGCMLGQGFLYAEPMDEEQFSDFLGRRAVN